MARRLTHPQGNTFTSQPFGRADAEETGGKEQSALWAVGEREPRPVCGPRAEFGEGGPAGQRPHQLLAVSLPEASATQASIPPTPCPQAGSAKGALLSLLALVQELMEMKGTGSRF